MPYELIPKVELEQYLEDAKEKAKREIDFMESYSHPPFDAIEASSANWVKKERENADDRLNRLEQEIRDEWDAEQGRGGSILNDIEVKMPALDMTFLEPLNALPLAMTALVDIIKNMFTFDIDDYHDTMAKIQQLKQSQERVE